MIITRCPYRVSFFGGGTDFPNWYKKNGCNIVTCSIDAYCYITIRKLLPFFGNSYRVSWSEIEEVNEIGKIRHPAIKGALELFDIKSGLEIHTDGDLPARSGLGSSSAFSSALILALSYLGAQRTLPNYNVMGLAKASLEANVRFMASSLGKDEIRVNGISAGPIKTLAASGVKNFRKMLTSYAKRAPLGRTVTTDEVGNVAAFLCSDLASGITGEITYVDGGFNTSALSIDEYLES